MNAQRATDDFGIFSTEGTAFGESPLVARERGLVCQGRWAVVSRAAIRLVDLPRKPAKAEQPMIRARIIEVLDGKQKKLLGDFHFVQLPVSNDKLVIANRRGSYDSMRVLYSAHAPELTIYVRWIRQMNTLEIHAKR